MILTPQQDASRRVAMMFPKSAELGLRFVSTDGAEHPGFDELEVEKAIGFDRFLKLHASLKEVFSCGHASYPEGHTKQSLVDKKGVPVNLAGYEVHCIYANDLEEFLKSGG